MNFTGSVEFPVDPNATFSEPFVPSQADLDQLTNAMSNPADRLMLSTGLERESESVLQNQILADRQTLSPMEFVNKYGGEIAAQVDQIIGGGNNQRYDMETTDRTGFARVGDTANNIATGLLGGVADAATFVGGAVNRDLGRAMAEGTDWFRDGMQSLQSEAQQRNREMDGIRAELDSRDNLLAYERDIANGDTGFEAGLAYLGRGLVNGISRFAENPMSLETGLAEGVGSLFAGGAIGKGLGVAGRLAGMGRQATSRMMPAAIGTMEGGSAYSGAVNEVMGMSHTELMDTSPSYRELLGRGFDPETAKETVAARAGEIAGAIQAPLGMATGKLVAGFEANPLGSRGFRDMVRNIVSETAEEGAQSASGAFAQNLGMRQADEDRLLIEGMGDQLAQGAVLGSLTAGVVQAPGVPGAAVRKAVQSLSERSAELRRANEEGSGVTPEQIRASAETIEANMDKVVEATDEMIAKADPEDLADVSEGRLKESVANFRNVTENDIEFLGEDVTRQFQENGTEVPNSRVALLQETANMVMADNTSMEARVGAAMFILKEMNQQEKVFNEEIEDLKGNLDQESESYKTINDYQSIIADLAGNEVMQKAMTWAASMSGIDRPADMVKAAVAKPFSIKRDKAQELLDQPDAPLSPTDRQMLQNAVDVGGMADLADQEIAKANADAGYDPSDTESNETSEVKRVHDEILTKGRKEEWGLSIDQHLARINSALKDGDAKGLDVAMRHFRGLAESQKNKADAAIRSAREGGKKTFKRLGSYGRENPTDGNITIHRNAPGSLALGRRVTIEANMLIDQYNKLLENNPMGAEPLARIEEAPEFFLGKKPKNTSQPSQTAQPARDMNEVEKTFVDGVFDRIVNMQGIPPRFMEIVDVVIEDKYLINEPDRLATAFHSIRDNRIRISISHKMAASIAAGERLEVAERIIAHEYSHGIDFYYRDPQTNMAHSQSRQFDADGPVRRELDAFFQTPEGKGLRDDLNKYVLSDPSNDGFTRMEVFAEMMAYYLVFPEKLQKNLPETFGIMENIADETFGKNRPKNHAYGRGSSASTPPAGSSGQKPAVAGTIRNAGDPSARLSRVETSFPFLVRVKDGFSRLHQAFRGEEIGPLLRRENPLRGFRDATETGKGLLEYVGREPAFDVDQAQSMALKKYLGFGNDIVKSMDKRLTEFMNKEKSKGRSWKDAFLEGDDIQHFPRLQGLQIVENVSDDLKYNRALLETAVLASLHWFAGSQNREAHMSREDIAKMIGKDESEISTSMMAKFQTGVSLTQITRSLSGEIMSFWGMQPNNDVDVKKSLGIAEGLAKEIVDVMVEQGFMARADQPIWVNYGVDDNGKNIWKSYQQFYFKGAIHENIRDTLKNMGPARKLIEMAAVPESQRNDATYGTPPKKIAKTQMRNKFVRNTKTQKQVIRKAQETPFYLNRNSYDMQQAIGLDAWIELMGSMVIGEDTKMNAQHRASIEGKNLTMEMAFNAMTEQVTEIENYAKKEGIPVEEARKYYQYNYSRVDRLQMLGAVQPQSDKIARHVFLPTKVTVDLTDSTSDDATGFFMAIAQGLDIQKVHHFSNQENADAARAAVLDQGGKYTDLVSELAQWLRDGKEGSLSDWSRRLRQADPKITEHGVMSLMSAAEYVVASDGNGAGLAEFTTYNYFEADGVTNGPANALMNLVASVSPEWIDTIKKAGAFLGQEAMSMISQKGLADLYTTASNTMADFQRHFYDSISGNKPVKEMHDALFRVMEGLGMKLSLTEEEGQILLTIERGVLKNPLTITIYGSGITGIAGNVTSELLDLVYEAMSESLQPNSTPFGEGMVVGGKPYSKEQFQKDFDSLIEKRVFVSEGEMGVMKTGKAGDNASSINSLEDYEVNQDGFETLRDNVLNLMVNQMHDAINHTVMGFVNETVTTVQKSSNAQSIVMHHLFRRELVREFAKRKMNPQDYPDYRPGDFLSQKDLDGIIRKLMPYGAVINTEHQSFFLGSGEQSDLFESIKLNIEGQEVQVSVPRNFATTMDDQMSTSTYTFAPKIAGVAVVPSFNIGTGDGRMIDVYMLQKPREEGVLPVFDGINMAVNSIISGSERANAAVAQTWSENPVQYQAKGFNDFLALNPLESLLDENDPFNFGRDKLLEDLTRNEEGTKKIKEVYSPEAIQWFFGQYGQHLNDLSERIGVRIEAQKALPMSVDQMAGGNTPYVQKGKVNLPANPSSKNIAKALENEMTKVRKKRAKDEKARLAIEKAEAPRKSFLTAFKEKALTDPDNGAMVADLEALQAIRRSLNAKLSNAHKEMLNASMASLSDSDFRVVLGTPESVTRWEQHNFPDSYEGEPRNYRGKIDVENRIIYLTDPSAETLAHELIHAATITKMQGYYADKKSVNVADGEAIERLEGLMANWMFEHEDRQTNPESDAHASAVTVIRDFLNQGKKAEALNEFIAWSLSNQQIINDMKKIEVKNPLYRIMGEALSQLKRLIWGHKKAPQIGTDMFSNVRFNARVLMATPTPLELFFKDFGETVLYQSTSFGSSNRLSEIRKRLADHARKYAREQGSTDAVVNKARFMKRKQDMLEALMRQGRTAEKMAVPFGLNMQEMSTFKWITAALSTVDTLNPSAFNRMQEVYDAVIDKIKVEDLMRDTGDEAADRYMAQERFNALTGVGVTEIDKEGRASHLVNFIALSVVSEDFRGVLQKMKLPQKVLPKGWKPDQALERLSISMSGALASVASGEGRNNDNMLASMEALTEALINNVGDQRSFIEQQSSIGLDAGDAMIKSYVEKGISKTQKWAETVRNPLGKKAATVLKNLTHEFTEEGKKKSDLAKVQFMNQKGMNTVVREAVNEIVGRTEENAPIFDMITRIRTLVDQTRQHWREKYPNDVRGWFKSRPTKEQMSDMFTGIGKADVAALFNSFDRETVLGLLSSGSKRKAEIIKLEAELNPRTIEKTKQMANWMMTGEAGNMLIRNAHAIAVVTNGGMNAAQIDALASLYAYEATPKKVRATIDRMMQTEPDAMENLLYSMQATRNDELSKAVTEKGMMNAEKGHLRGENQEGVHLTVQPKSEHARLMSMGYTYMGDYHGSSSDSGSEKKGYYFAPVSGLAKYNQGVIQTVNQTYFGVDPDTGFMAGSITAGRITEPRAVAAINKRIAREGKTDERLIPIYDGSGMVIGYERSIDPKKLALLNPDNDISKALGAWRGRQFEEKTSAEVNRNMVDRLHKIWINEKTSRKNEYVNLAKSKDKIHRDAWSVIPKDTKDYIEQTFGKDNFLIRADMLNDSVGARMPSVGDFWTGNTRFSPEAQKNIKEILTGFGGNKMYTRLVQAEEMWQGAITDAKVMIVIRSVVVPAMNLISNVYQLANAGVPLRNVFHGYKTKTVELNDYIKRKERERQLQNELYVAEGREDTIAIRKLSTRIRALQDSYKNMSIWPLIEAGEFGAITDGNLSSEDIAIAKGNYAAVVDRMVHKLPEGVLRETGRYAAVTRDTELFRLMTRATQYGDFIAKAVLYDDLVKRKKMEHNDALGFVNEEFINYNRFAGRTRSYAEAMGLTWFWHYKLRSMKIAQRTMQRNPLRAILLSTMLPRVPLMGTVGSPLTDNFLSVLMDGRLGYSIGPGMLFRAPSLHPWWNLTN